ncbi:uncharacterized protein I303_100013 [Kwoniella dejecticola CBS 10117]|uniref:Protein CPL1-like domain-containing protein n=1 Tax=Kwoniella dejecticola CBS 10117 TaxID=1296121 RepID=A0A1A6ADQ5_9TREE|nr:uncharacterized protein I303_00013 [Kwoniella dejecticola CBS 10117]OBR88202.1 hypothetical protein I303_00013 [Kwoniella dejecticola CBS 10117]
MWSKATLALLVFFTLFVKFVQADNAFAGCFSILPSATTQATGTFSSATACDAACPNNKHSFYQLSTKNCYCTDKYPSEGYFQLGTADACNNPAHYDARITHTSFTWRPTCYSTAPTGLTFSGLTGPDTCLKNCGTSLGATFYVDSIDGNYQCACGQPNSFGSTAACGPGTYFYYYHTAAQASQGLSRRRKIEEERKRGIHTYCPKGLTPCQIEDIPGAYECIDTNAELESCGGCLYGSLSSPNATIGQDCSSVQATLGGVTCESGRCVAYKCKSGYTLIDQQCVPRKGYSVSSKAKTKRRRI